MDYNLSADLLNKFSQLTPWVQAILAATPAACVLGLCLTLTTICGRRSGMKKTTPPSATSSLL